MERSKDAAPELLKRVAVEVLAEDLEQPNEATFAHSRILHHFRSRQDMQRTLTIGHSDLPLITFFFFLVVSLVSA